MVAHREAQRLQNLYAYRILDTPESVNYDRIVEMAAELFRVPVVAISLIDTTRQWFEAPLAPYGQADVR